MLTFRTGDAALDELGVCAARLDAPNIPAATPPANISRRVPPFRNSFIGLTCLYMERVHSYSGDIIIEFKSGAPFLSDERYSTPVKRAIFLYRAAFPAAADEGRFADRMVISPAVSVPDWLQKVRP
jgi:hypothetical protein